MGINEKLIQLYAAQINGLKDICDKSELITATETYSKWDGPILMHCWEQDYNNAAFKILFIGQEPNTWIDRAWDEVERPLERYEKFALAENKKDKTTFWKAIFDINNFINSGDQNSKQFLWTNVSKYSTWEGKRINDTDFNFINQRLNLLQEEIKIVNPNVIIFFSGPDYDQWIKSQFNGNISFDEPLLQNISTRELCLVKLDTENLILPVHTYRTYHPNYLNQKKKWYFLNAIVLDFMGFNLENIVKKLKDDFSHLKHVIIDDVEISNYFGNKEFTLKVKVSQWENFSIGFQFEENVFCSFFYGILNDKEVENEKILVQINSLQDNNEKSSELWPFWNWYEQKNWSKKTFEEIQSGEFIIKIQRIIDNILERTKGWDM